MLKTRLDLPTNQLEWGVADPMSSVARLNYRRGTFMWSFLLYNLSTNCLGQVFMVA